MNWLCLSGVPIPKEMSLTHIITLVFKIYKITLKKYILGAQKDIKQIKIDK